METQKLVYFVGDFDLNSLGEVWVDTKYTRCEFLDDDLKPLIYKYSIRKIFVLETLRVFVKNDFKTDEEKRHDREVSSISNQLKLTRIALGVTIAGLMVPIFVTSIIDIKNVLIVTELNEKTITKTRDAIKQGTALLTRGLLALKEN